MFPGREILGAVRETEVRDSGATALLSARREEVANRKRERAYGMPREIEDYSRPVMLEHRRVR